MLCHALATLGAVTSYRNYFCTFAGLWKDGNKCKKLTYKREFSKLLLPQVKIFSPGVDQRLGVNQHLRVQPVR